ncbi:hypothetical protein AB4Y30_16350 [Ornithinibacillus sp. 4-3]|uniref:Uncharacterized protein n=1 Tax=Ornithinibacillus sp. 4-3 TaxID=3231488 RepID=A0AB39HRC7_9BACI
MKQVSFYDYFPKQNDPLYIALSKVTEEKPIQLGNFTITLNTFGIYEILSDDIHEAKDSLDACYHYLNDLGKFADFQD